MQKTKLGTYTDRTHASAASAGVRRSCASVHHRGFLSVKRVGPWALGAIGAVQVNQVYLWAIARLHHCCISETVQRYFQGGLAPLSLPAHLLSSHGAINERLSTRTSKPETRNSHPKHGTGCPISQSVRATILRQVQLLVFLVKV